MGIYEYYNWLFNEVADPRVKDWPIMGSPLPMILTLAVYLYTVKVSLPAWMRDRKAFSLKTVIYYYNIFQVVANSILFWGLLTSGWTTTLTLGCEMPDFSPDNEEAVRMASWLWWTFMLKIVELIETMFFVLRKKDNQASVLHIYHHMITPSLLWLGVKFVPGGMTSFTPTINTFVHIIMYTYYLISSQAGPSLRLKLNKWKKWITILQMIQFTVILLHSSQTLAPSCPAPIAMIWIFIPNVIVIYYLFYDFFKNAYNKAPKEKA